MKKRLLIIFFLICAVHVNAQRFDAGLVGGLNATQVDGDSFHGYHKAGIVLGAFVETKLSEKTYAGMELKYAQKGSRENPHEDDAELRKYIMRLGYIDIPFYFGYQTNDRLSVLGGISFGYLMHGGEWDNYGKFIEPEQKPFKDFDYQAFLGGRFKINEKLKFDLRFAYSFMPVRKLPAESYWYWWDDQFNNVISTCIYYTF